MGNFRIGQHYDEALRTMQPLEIKCYLESIDAAELIEEQFKLRVEEEIEKIKDFVTIIEY